MASESPYAACRAHFWHHREVPTGTQPDPSPFAFEVARLLRHALRAADISQQTAAEATGLSTSQVSKLLSGGRTLTIDQAMDLAEVAGVDGIELMEQAEKNVAEGTLSADAPTVTDAMDIADEVHGIDEGKKETYGLAARRGRRKADQQPHAE